MSDHPQVWIQGNKGVRRLQHEELAKAKGVLSEWLKGGKLLRQFQVDQATCLHLWMAAMDTICPLKEEGVQQPKEKGSDPKSSMRDGMV
jgi:hypothetical protein